MKPFYLLFCLLLATSAHLFTPARAQVDVNDSLALVDLYNSTNGPGWDNNTNWLTTKPLSTWYGVGVSGTRVWQIYLQSEGLTGTLPASIGNLTRLNNLNLGSNMLSGSIPASIGNLVNLYTLYLSINQLSSSVPASIGNLVNLRNLTLAGNQLSGSIPSSIGNLLNLTILNLSSNQLSGSIPASIGNLTNLFYLQISNNQLTGSIPSSIGNLANLQALNLSYNQLTGTIPSSFGNLVSLTSLSLNDNQLSGNIPSSFKQLTFLSTLILSRNRLSGSIPGYIGNLSNLGLLQLNNNRFTGAIPSTIGKLRSMYVLSLTANQLTGSIPSSIGNLVALNFLNLSYNQLTGTIPTSIGKLKRLQRINISHNQLSHNENVVFPVTKRRSEHVDVSYNRFTFNGLEYLATKFVFRILVYTPQAIIPVHSNGNTLSVYAGGTLSNNTYHWFRVGTRGSTEITGDSTFSPTRSGRYYVQVTNAVATQLILHSDTINFTANAIAAAHKLTVAADSKKLKQVFRVWPNPASHTVNVQTSGAAAVSITNSAGKLMLTKMVYGNAAVDVSSFAGGVYYIKNTATGEVRKIIVAH